MTGYAIEVGYNSAHYKEDVWITLLVALKKIRANPEVIWKEVLEVEEKPELPYTLDQLKEMAEWYKNCDDLTIRIKHEKDYDFEDDEKEPSIRQCASSGNGKRGLKEQCRRAVCRLLIKAAHKEGMEVNMIVS